MYIEVAEVDAEVGVEVRQSCSCFALGGTGDEGAPPGALLLWWILPPPSILPLVPVPPLCPAAEGENVVAAAAALVT